MKINQLKMGTILSYVILTLDLIIGLVYTPILTKSLGQSEYGLYALIASIISYLTLLDLGFGSAIVVYTTKYITKKEKEKENRLYGMFFIIYSIIGIIAGVLGYILYLNAENLFADSMTIQEIERAKIMMLILTINLVITFPMSIFSSIITAYEKFIFAKSVNIIRLIINPLIMIPLLYNGYKSVAIVIVTTILNIITLIANMVYCLKKIKIKFNFKKFNFKLLREMFAFSFFIFLNIIVDKVNWSIDQFVLGTMIGTISVATYNIAAHINTIYISFSTAISGVLLPKMTRMETENASDKEFSEVFIKMGRLQYILIALIITGFVLIGKEFMILWQGENYIKSYYIACILMIPATIPLIQNTGLSILRAKSKHRVRTIILFIIAILNILISIVLAKRYEGIGTAIGTAISLIIGQVIIMNIYYYKKIHINIPQFWKEILKMTIPVIIVFPIGIILNKILIANSYVILFLKAIIYTGIYLTLMWFCAMNEYEKNIFLTPIKKIKNLIVKKK